jgi:hypothetical protein
MNFSLLFEEKIITLGFDDLYELGTVNGKEFVEEPEAHIGLLYTENCYLLQISSDDSLFAT